MTVTTPPAAPLVSDIFPALKRIGACEEATFWLRDRPAISWQAAWESCERGDWMLWLIGRFAWAPRLGTAPHRRLIGCLVDVQYALAWPWLHDRHEATIAGPVRRCLDALERYADGEEVTRDELWAARRDAWSANGAAWNERLATATAVAAATAAATAAVATVATAATADTAAADAWRLARADALRCAAEIVRRHYPTAPEMQEADHG